MRRNAMDIIQVGNVLLSIDCFRNQFACDLGACRGACCIEGDAGAPLTEDEALAIEDILPEIEADLTPEAREVINRQGVAYIDRDGDLVTSIVNGRDCVFCHHSDKGICLCAIEKAQREGRISTAKPISCDLYPFRLREFRGGLVGINYHRWDICYCAEQEGRRLALPAYKFLRAPLIRRFGAEWYADLERAAQSLELNKD